MTEFIHRTFVSWPRTLLAIFVIAFLVRAAFILTLQDAYYFPDSLDYSRAAVNLISTGELGETYKRPPAYPVFLAVVYVLIGDTIPAVRLVESALGALLAVMIGMIGRRVGGDAVGILAGLIWSLYPLAIFIAGLVYPTTLLATLLACGVLCFLPYLQGEFSHQKIFCAGVFWGLAALTKPVVLASLAAVSLWVLACGRKQRLVVVVLLLTGSALTIVPWAIRDYYVYNRLVLIEPRVVEHLPTMRNAEPKLRAKKIDAIISHPGEFGARVIFEFFHFWRLQPDRVRMSAQDYREKLHAKNSQIVRETIFGSNNFVNVISILSTGPLFLFAILGTIALLFEPERRRYLGLLWTTILSFAVTYSFFFTQTRYRVPIEPYIAILSACGLKKCWDLLAVRHGKVQVEAKAQAKLTST